MHSNILVDIALCIITATVFAFIAKWLRQPLLLGYVLAGVVIGSTQGFGWIAGPEEIETISELGLILLLFMIGLEIDLKKLRKSGAGVIGAGVGQFVICTGLGLGFAPLLGFHFGPGRFEPLYLAIGVALSSTMIVVKLLYDKFELDTLPGRVTLSILVFQDIWAILFLAVQPNLQDPSPVVLVVSLAKGAGLVAFAMLASRYILPLLFQSIAKLPELMLIGALAWCFAVSMIAAWLGLSREMGALIAGVSISTFPYSLDVIAKVISLRDFFITLFFVTLGAKVPRPTVDIVLLALAGSGFLIVSRFLSVTPILYFMKYGNRASFLPALNLAQISEFSLVISALGVGLGHIDDRLLSVVLFMLVITSVLSTYWIMYSHSIFLVLNPWMKRLGMRDLGEETAEDAETPHKPIVFLGFARTASALLHELISHDDALEEQISVVDFNPQVKKELDRRGIHCVYGDIGHADTLHHAGIHHAKVLISTIPDSLLKGTSNERLLRQLNQMAPEACVIVTSETLAEASEMYQEGAGFVLVPRLMGAQELRDAVIAALKGELEDMRRAAAVALETRSEVLP
ncbi:MAG: cation:proton antiporter [Acidobacteria bacterium]|nr:cation:proton antiporter [Acidobacteriota bacterium]